MKSIAKHLLTLLSLAALASVSAAQIVPPPEISSIPPRNAFDPGRVQILGTNMGLVVGVRIDGQGVPIIRKTGTKVVVGPLAPRAPGFALVELRNAQGQTVDSATMEFNPTLSAVRQRNS